MGQNQIKGVITEIVETKLKKSSFDVFLSTEDIPVSILNKKTRIGETRSMINSVLLNAKQEYARILRNVENQLLFKKMAELETTIIQARCSLVTETKLTLVNQKRGGSETSYVVARAPFYNPDNVKAEIRVYLGKAEELGNDLDKLSNDTKFMENAEKQIVQAMFEVMNKRGVLASIKKSSEVKVLVTSDGDEEINTDVKPVQMKRPVHENPFAPKHEPKPKGGYGFLGGKLKNEKG